MAASVIEIAPGGVIIKDPADKAQYKIIWDDHFLTGVQLIDSGVFLIGVFYPTDQTDTSPLEIDSKVLLAESRSVQFRALGGTPNFIYVVTHHVVTDEPQEKERSFYFQVQER